MVDFCLRIVTFAYPWSPAPSTWRVVLVVKHRLFDGMVVVIHNVVNHILVHRILRDVVVDVLVFEVAAEVHHIVYHVDVGSQHFVPNGVHVSW